jgi:hypothetical protein
MEHMDKLFTSLTSGDHFNLINLKDYIKIFKVIVTGRISLTENSDITVSGIFFLTENSGHINTIADPFEVGKAYHVNHFAQAAAVQHYITVEFDLQGWPVRYLDLVTYSNTISYAHVFLTYKR